MAKRQAELKKKDAAAAVEAATLQAETDRMKALAAQEAAAKNPAPAQNAASVAGATRQPANAAPLPPTPADRKLGGCVMIGCSDPKAKDVAMAKATPAAPSAGTVAASPTAPATGFAALYEPTVLTGRTASRLSDLTYLLTKGTSIPCGLKTAIDTTLPGLVVCQTTKDVYSANGKLLLIERGSKVFGEQKSALSQGQDRVYALWTRIDTPQGVSINIDSPITDSLGRSGAEAYVDTHFWERFGAAIMLSLLDGVNFNIQSPYTIGTPIGYITPSVSNGNSSSNNSGTSSNKSIASEVLKNSINIPPTGNINAGSIVNVMVARDVSFQGVYGLVQ
jgi:type IV secretion system protein VirB10